MKAVMSIFHRLPGNSLVFAFSTLNTTMCVNECGLFMLMWFEMGYFSITDLLLVQTSAQKRKHIAALYPLRLLCNPID